MSWLNAFRRPTPPPDGYPGMIDDIMVAVYAELEDIIAPEVAERLADSIGAALVVRPTSLKQAGVTDRTSGMAWWLTCVFISKVVGVRTSEAVVGALSNGHGVTGWVAERAMSDQAIAAVMPHLQQLAQGDAATHSGERAAEMVNRGVAAMDQALQRTGILVELVKARADAR